MGLDMYVYRISGLTDEEKKEVEEMSYDDLCAEDFTVFDWDEEHEHRMSPIKDFLTIVKKPVENIHFDLVKKVFDIPKAAEYSGFGSGPEGRFIYFTDDNEHKTYTVEYDKATSEQRKQVTVTDMMTFAVFHSYELIYWRKAYDLQDKLHEACDVYIENCGYYPLNDKMRQAIKDSLEKEGRESEIELLEPVEGSAICYHEWY